MVPSIRFLFCLFNSAQSTDMITALDFSDFCAFFNFNFSFDFVENKLRFAHFHVVYFFTFYVMKSDSHGRSTLTNTLYILYALITVQVDLALDQSIAALSVITN